MSMTPTQKRRNTIFEKILEENPGMSLFDVEQEYLRRQREIASKGGKNPNSYRGFRDQKVSQRAARNSHKNRNYARKSKPTTDS